MNVVLYNMIRVAKMLKHLAPNITLLFVLLLQLLNVFADVIQTMIKMMISLITFHVLLCIVSVTGSHVLVGQTSCDPFPPYTSEAVTV